MFAIDHDIINLHDTYSAPDSYSEKIEKERNERELMLLKQQGVSLLAEYIKRHKNRAISLLEKHGAEVSEDDQSIVNAFVEMLDIGGQRFRDDVVLEISKLEIGNGNKDESNIDPITITAIVSGISSLVSGGFKLGASSKQRQAEKEAAKREILVALANQKQQEAENKAKAKRMNTLVVAAIVIVLLIVLIVVFIKTRQKK